MFYLCELQKVKFMPRTNACFSQGVVDGVAVDMPGTCTKNDVYDEWKIQMEKRRMRFMMNGRSRQSRKASYLLMQHPNWKSSKHFKEDVACFDHTSKCPLHTKPWRRNTQASAYSQKHFPHASRQVGRSVAAARAPATVAAERRLTRRFYFYPHTVIKPPWPKCKQRTNQL